MKVSALYEVRLTYFTPEGKFYGEAGYVTEHADLYDIWDEVEQFRRTATLPGLIAQSSHYVLVDVPQHPRRHPHLVLCQQTSSGSPGGTIPRKPSGRQGVTKTGAGLGK